MATGIGSSFAGSETSALHARVARARESGNGLGLAEAAWKLACQLIEDGDLPQALVYLDEARRASDGSGGAPSSQHLTAVYSLCQAVLSFDASTLDLEAGHRRMMGLRESERLRLVEALRSTVSLAGPSSPFPESESPQGSVSVQALPFALGVVMVSLPFSLQVLPRRLDVRVLGSFDVDVDGAPIGAWRNGRARQVFAYLALSGRKPVSRQSLMGIFWPEHSQERATNNLSLAVMTARRVLEAQAGASAAGIIASTPGSYVIDEDIDLRVDADIFTASVERARALEASGRVEDAAEALDRAISVYGGDFLPSDLYEEWTMERRERLRDLYADALFRRARLARQARDVELAIRLTRLLLEVDSSSEEAHRSLMLDYWSLGQRGRALRQMEVMREAMRRLLGVEPTEETNSLYSRILRAP
jgi:DNA-binding SARP family transcriptional activator